MANPIGKSKGAHQMALFALVGLLQHVPQIEEAKYRAKVMHMHSQPPSHLTPLALCVRCTFAAAAAVRVQSAICCGCDLANCLQEKQKAKTIQLSPNNPTTATARRRRRRSRRRMTTRRRCRPYIAWHFAALTLAPTCVWLRCCCCPCQRLLPVVCLTTSCPLCLPAPPSLPHKG